MHHQVVLSKRALCIKSNRSAGVFQVPRFEVLPCKSAMVQMFDENVECMNERSACSVRQRFNF